jgi:hypothetical protein
LKNLLFILLLIGINNRHECQIRELSPEEYLKNKNYLNALVGFKMQHHKNPEKVNLLKKIGYCILESNIDRSKASRYFKDYLNDKPKDKEVWISLCYSYLYGYNFNKARQAVDDYMLNNGKNKKLIIETLQQIEIREKLYYANQNISIKNLGNKVNSSKMESCPYVEIDERFIIYRSNKEGNKGNLQLNGSYNNDIFISRYNGLYYQKNKSLKTLNTNLDERIIGIDQKGTFIYYKNINPFAKTETPIIMQAKKRGLNYKKKKIFREVSFDKKIIVNHIFLNDQHNKCFISAKNQGEKNRYKIYELKKLPNQTWGNPKEIKDINLQGNNIAPYFHTKSNTLYFSSDKDQGMGGYDLYKTTFNLVDKAWTDPENMGYPVNSPYDERSISFNKQGNRAFISTIRPGGLGDYDIYQLDFLDKDVKRAVFIVEVYNKINEKKLIDAEIEIYNTHDILIGQYLPNEVSGNFSIILESGEYLLNCIIDGETVLKRKLNVTDFDTQKENKKLKLNIEL